MESGKAMILNAVSKKTAGFKLAHIVNDTSLERQLVHYHLKKFVDAGWLEKVGQFYFLVDLPAIIDELVAVSKAETSTAKPESGTVIVPTSGLRVLTEMASHIRYTMVLGVPCGREFHDVFVGDIDASIAVLKQLKKYINNYQPSLTTSAKAMSKDTSLYESVVDSFKQAPSVSRSEWISALNEKVEDILE